MYLHDLQRLAIHLQCTHVIKRATHQRNINTTQVESP